MAAAFGGLRSAFAGISPRERRLLTILGSVLGGLALFAVLFFSSVALDDLETERAQAVDALRTIRNERPRIRQRQERREAMLARYRVRAPALTSFVESAARDANVTVAEATDRTVPAPAGGHFARRAVSIRLRHVDLQSLVSFMDRIEAAEFPVAITGIRIRKRFGESNSYDVDDMVISTWDRVEAAAGTGRGGAGGTRGTGNAGSASGATSSAPEPAREPR
jgi:type II secretory pathway component PulM